MKTPKRRRGRPRLPSPADRLEPIATRIPLALIALLRAASKASGWNISVEMRHRLAKSFEKGNQPMRPDMKVSEARQMLRTTIIETLDRDGTAPTRDQLLQADIDPAAINLLFRSVLVEVIRQRCETVSA